jgi:glycosyltransferase involved in cell wall biosynthesis
LRKYVQAEQLHNVRFVDALSPDELSRYYAAADIFVFPSLEDVWGLVVNEALCFGLPVLGSCFAGATQGLLRGSRLGVEFDPTDKESFAAHLTALRRAPPPIDRVEGLRIIEGVTFERSQEAILRLLDVIVRVR